MAILAGDDPSESVKVRHSALDSEISVTAWKQCKLGGKLVLIANRNSGVTSVGATLFFLEKTNDILLVIALWKVMTFLAVVSSLLPVYPVFFSKFSHKKIYSGVTPWMVSPGAVDPAVTPLIRKSYMSFRFVPTSVTLNELERRNGRDIALFQ